MDLQTPPGEHHVVTARIENDLDAAAAPRVGRYLRELVRPGSRVLLDMSDVTFLDCAGLSQILAADRRAAVGGGWVRLTSLRSGPRRVVELTRSAHLLSAPHEARGGRPPER